MSYTTEQQAKLAKFDRKNMRVITRGESGFPVLLYDLLHLGNPYPHEEPVRTVITSFLDEKGVTGYSIDPKGNLVVTVGGSSSTLFSCHMDTVHKGITSVIPMMQQEDGKDTGFVFGATYEEVRTEKVVGWRCMYSGKEYPVDMKAHMPEYTSIWFVPVKGSPEEEYTMHGIKGATTYRFNHTLQKMKEVVVSQAHKESVLGADDKLGCYLMCEMIVRKVPGTYIFHVGEECGAHGSRYIRAQHDTSPDTSPLKGIKRAIAFDRKGYSDVIGSQGSTTASKQFTTALAAALNEFAPPKQQFVGNVAGVFTDTKVYAPIISECTNLSVGYFNQHFHYEHFDLYWLLDNLLPMAAAIDWESIPTSRTPVEESAVVYTRPGNYNWNYGSNYGDWKSGDTVRKIRTVHEFSDAELEALTPTTPLVDIPMWEPQDGWVGSLPKTVMRKLVEKWYIWSKKDDIIEAMLDAARYTADLEDFIETCGDTAYDEIPTGIVTENVG